MKKIKYDESVYPPQFHPSTAADPGRWRGFYSPVTGVTNHSTLSEPRAGFSVWGAGAQEQGGQAACVWLALLGGLLSWGKTDVNDAR